VTRRWTLKSLPNLSLSLLAEGTVRGTVGRRVTEIGAIRGVKTDAKERTGMTNEEALGKVVNVVVPEKPRIKNLEVGLERRRKWEETIKTMRISG